MMFNEAIDYEITVSRRGSNIMTKAGTIYSIKLTEARA